MSRESFRMRLLTQNMMRLQNSRHNWRRSRSPSISITDDDVEAEQLIVARTENRVESTRASTVFKKRRCVRFAPKKAGAVCWCGRKMEEHQDEKKKEKERPKSGVDLVDGSGDATPSPPITPTTPLPPPIIGLSSWEQYFAKCTVAEKTDAFGSISFAVDGVLDHDYWFAEATKRYIRLDRETPARDLFERLLVDEREWNLGEPGLIVNVIGDVGGGEERGVGVGKELRPGQDGGDGSMNVRRAFRDCLFKVFRDTPNSWVITNGVHSGISKYVGEVVREINMSKNQVEERIENVSITCIGVTSWSSVRNSERLVNLPGLEGRGRKVAYSISENGGGKGEYLDPNHTHFLLVDDGTVGRFASEAAFKDKIMEISSCPCANLLFGGDLNSLDEVICSLTKKQRAVKSVSSYGRSQSEDERDYRTPCIVIKGSGKAADLVALAMQQLKLRRKNQNFDQFVGELLASRTIVNAVEEFGNELGKGIKPLKARLKKCLENHELIYVFDPHEDESVNVEVLKAFRQHGRGSNEDKLFVAYLWNRMDVAEEVWREMICNEKDVKSEKWVIKALAEGNVEFVRLFLVYACEKGNFLTKLQLKDLYTKYVAKSKKEQIVRFLAAESAVGISGYESYLMTLLSYYEESYRAEVALAGKRDIENQFIGKNVTFSSLSLKAEKSEEFKKRSFTQTCADLFVWSVLAGHFELAKLFIEINRHATAHGLVAANILRGMIKVTDSETEKQLLESQAVEFEQYAMDVMCRCNDVDPIKTKFVLVQGLDIFDGTSCMELAARDQNCLEFICHPACQSHLTDIWRRCHKKNKCTYFSVTFFALIFYIQVVLCVNNYDMATEAFTSPTLAGVVLSGAMALNLLIIVVLAVRGMKTMRKRQKPLKDFKELQNHKRTNDRLYSIGINCGWTKTNGRRADCLRDALDFFRSPVIKFYLHSMSYSVYLAVYAYFLIFDAHANLVMAVPSCAEWIVYLYWASYMAQEIKQMSKNDLAVPIDLDNPFQTWGDHLLSCLKMYLSNSWNVFDLVILLSSATLLGFRISVYNLSAWHSRATEQYLMLSYSVVFALFFLRLLQFFLVNIHLGPKLLMINQMIRDLSYFLLFLVVFLFSFSMVSHTMLDALNPGQRTVLDLDLVAELWRRGFWNLFGETFQEEYQELYESIKSANGTSKSGLPTYPEMVIRIIIPLMQGIYMFVTVVLLINLLIATFTYNITKLQEKEVKLWFIHRKEVIFENYNRPTLPQPFSLVVNVRDLFIWIRKKFASERIYCCDVPPKVFVCRMLCVSAVENIKGAADGKKLLKRIERWEKMMTNSVQESRLAEGRTDSAFNIAEIKASVHKLVKMQTLEDLGLENLDVRGKLAQMDNTIERLTKELTTAREEGRRGDRAESGPCRRNCAACPFVREADRFRFVGIDERVFFVQERTNCESRGLVVGVVCLKCGPDDNLVVDIVEGFAVKETPNKLPVRGGRGRDDEDVVPSAQDVAVRTYLKTNLRSVALERMATPPPHFDAEDHDAAKHMRFLGIETVDAPNKGSGLKRIPFWKEKLKGGEGRGTS